MMRISEDRCDCYGIIAKQTNRKAMNNKIGSCSPQFSKIR